MTEVVTETKREVGLDRLEVLVKRANELRANLAALVSAIESKYSSDPRWGSLVSNVVRAMRPPELPEQQLFDLASGLEQYVSKLEHSVRQLTEYAVLLDKLQDGLEKLEREAEELATWSELLKEAAPHLASNATRLAIRARRVVQHPPLEDLRKGLEELELLLREAKSHNRVCRTAYVNRANELLSMASQLVKTVRKARAESSLLEASKLQAFEEELKDSIRRLNEAAKQPLAVKLDLMGVKSQLETIEREVSLLVEKVLSEADRDLTREIEHLARSLDGKIITLSTLLDILSKRTGSPIETLARQLVTLEKRGFITVHVKLEV